MSAPTYPAGTVVRYNSERPNRWCREGMAIADKDGRLVDTYWNVGGDNHVLTASETETVRSLFNLADYHELERGHERTWANYHPDARQVVTAQHGLIRRLFVRNGAEPDLGTQIENAREAVREAEEQVRSAERRVTWCREDLARLEGGDA